MKCNISLNYANPFKRLLSIAIDLSIAALSFYVIVWVVRYFFRLHLHLSEFLMQSEYSIVLFELLLIVTISFFVALFTFSKKRQISVGMFLLKMKLVNNFDNNSMGFLKSFCRALLLISFIFISVVVTNYAHLKTDQSNFIEAKKVYFKHLPEIKKYVKNNNLDLYFYIKTKDGLEAVYFFIDKFNKEELNDFNNEMSRLEPKYSNFWLDIVSYLPLILLTLWYLPMFFTKTKSATHDLIFKTALVSVK